MRLARVGWARLWTVVGCTVSPVAGLACGPRPPGASGPAPASADTLAPAGAGRALTLHVTNSNWSDVRIYIVRGRLTLRLGLVTGSSSADLQIPPDFVTAAGGATLVAVPVGGQADYRAPLPGLAPGDVLELTVAAFLQYSSLVVR